MFLSPIHLSFIVFDKLAPYSSHNHCTVCMEFKYFHDHCLVSYIVPFFLHHCNKVLFLSLHSVLLLPNTSSLALTISSGLCILHHVSGWNFQTALGSFFSSWAPNSYMLSWKFQSLFLLVTPNINTFVSSIASHFFKEQPSSELKGHVIYASLKEGKTLLLLDWQPQGVSSGLICCIQHITETKWVK